MIFTSFLGINETDYYHSCIIDQSQKDQKFPKTIKNLFKLLTNNFIKYTITITIIFFITSKR